MGAFHAGLWDILRERDPFLGQQARRGEEIPGASEDDSLAWEEAGGGGGEDN